MWRSNKTAHILARNGWRPVDAVRLLLAVGAVLVATWPAWLEMAREATRHDSTRPSVMVIPIMVWLIWVRRARFRFVRPGGYGIGCVVLFTGAMLFYMNRYVYDLRSLWQLGAVLMLAGAIFVCTGKSLIRQFAPAWLIMPLLVPVPYTVAMLIAAPIQELEAHTISTIYAMFGVSVQVLTTPGGGRLVVGGRTLPMESVCKGLPTIMSLMLICYGFVFSSPIRAQIRATLLMIAPGVALLCSAIALGATLWLYDGQWALVTADLINAISQWVTLLVAFLLIAGALRLMTWASVPVHQYHLASTSA